MSDLGTAVTVAVCVAGGPLVGWAVVAAGRAQAARVARDHVRAALDGVRLLPLPDEKAVENRTAALLDEIAELTRHYVTGRPTGLPPSSTTLHLGRKSPFAWEPRPARGFDVPIPLDLRPEEVATVHRFVTTRKARR